MDIFFLRDSPPRHIKYWGSGKSTFLADKGMLNVQFHWDPILHHPWPQAATRWYMPQHLLDACPHNANAKAIFSWSVPAI
jgi:hypothetical protein